MKTVWAFSFIARWLGKEMEVNGAGEEHRHDEAKKKKQCKC